MQITEKSVSEPPFGWLRGNVRTPSVAHWIARGWLYIRHDERFSLSFAVEML